MINTLYTKSAILFGAISLAGGAAGQDITNMEREQAVRYLADTRAGLAVMKIAYSDGVKGILVVGCNFGPPAPAAIFEGTTATKGFVDYYNALYPDFTFGNTIFHVLHED